MSSVERHKQEMWRKGQGTTLPPSPCTTQGGGGTLHGGGTDTLVGVTHRKGLDFGSHLVDGQLGGR